MKRFIFLFLLATTILACSKENAHPTTLNTDSRLTFDLSYPGATKADASGFSSSDKVGVYVYESSLPLQLAGNTVNNSPLVFNGISWDPVQSVFWNKDTEYNVAAYYPYIADVKSIKEHPWSVQLDQNSPATAESLNGYEASDFLWAGVENVQPSNDPVELTFAHRLSCLRVNLLKGEDYDGDLPDADEIEVYVHNTVPEAFIDFETGFVTKDYSKRARTIRAHSDGNHSYSAIIVPQLVNDVCPMVEVVMKGVSYLFEKRFSYKMNTLHQITITIAKSPNQVKIEIGGEIQNWN